MAMNTTITPEEGKEYVSVRKLSEFWNGQSTGSPCAKKWIQDFVNENQYASVSIVKNPLTNINGRELSNYTATLGTTHVGTETYTTYTIKYGSTKLTEEKTRNYMEYMTGQRSLPVYNYEKPENSFFIFEDFSIWKPQYDSSNGLLLFSMGTISPFVPGTGSNSAVLKGSGSSATGNYSVAEGRDTTASGQHSHAEGYKTKAEGAASHAEGATYNNIDTAARADAAHAEGAGVVVKGQAAHGEGLLNVAGRTQEEAVAALADFPNLGGTTEQKVSKLIGFASHSEGSSTQALGTSSHAEGNFTQALVNATHAEGDTTTASGEAAHSEGYKTTASGNQAHAEGYNTEATANQSHAEGKHTKATSENAHAEGNYTTANGNASHTEGYYTVADNNVEHAEGKYNASHTGSTNAEKTIHSVGIGTGTSNTARKNAFEIMQNGDAYLLGVGNYVGTTIKTGSNNVKTVKEVINGKQDTLIGSGAGQNIKTINGNNILGTGDITISGSGAYIMYGVYNSDTRKWQVPQTDLANGITAFVSGRLVLVALDPQYASDETMEMVVYKDANGLKTAFNNDIVANS